MSQVFIVSFWFIPVMAEGSGQDVVSEYLQQNPHLADWVESLRELSETNKHWHSRREFILRNMEVFPTIQPGITTPSLDRLLSLSKVWANQTFLGCRYVRGADVYLHAYVCFIAGGRVLTLNVFFLL